MPRHIPEPPPVQKRTFPLKISGLKTAVESTIGTSYGEGDMARELEARQQQQLAAQTPANPATGKARSD